MVPTWSYTDSQHLSCDMVKRKEYSLENITHPECLVNKYTTHVCKVLHAKKSWVGRVGAEDLVLVPIWTWLCQELLYMERETGHVVGWFRQTSLKKNWNPRYNFLIFEPPWVRYGNYHGIYHTLVTGTIQYRTGRPQWYSQGPGHWEIVTQCQILAVGHRVRWPGLGSRRSAWPISLYHFPPLYQFPLSKISQVDTLCILPSFWQFRISVYAVRVKG